MHLLFGAGFALARAALELAVQIPLDSARGLERDWVKSFSNAVAVVLIFGFHEGVLAYWVILSIQSTFRYRERYQERARQALKLELSGGASSANRARATRRIEDAAAASFSVQYLNAIVVLVRQQKGEQAEEALMRFSDLLRAVLDDRPLTKSACSRCAVVRLKSSRSYDQSIKRWAANPF